MYIMDNFYEEFLFGGGKQTTMTVVEIKQALKNAGASNYSTLKRMDLLKMAAKVIKDDPIWKMLLKEEKSKLRKKEKAAVAPKKAVAAQKKAVAAPKKAVAAPKKAVAAPKKAVAKKKAGPKKKVSSVLMNQYL